VRLPYAEHRPDTDIAHEYDLRQLFPEALIRKLGRVRFHVTEDAVFLDLLEDSAAHIQLRVDVDSADRPELLVWRAGGLDEGHRLEVDLLTAEVVVRNGNPFNNERVELERPVELPDSSEP
jgi:hypothetical protein